MGSSRLSSAREDQLLDRVVEVPLDPRKNSRKESSDVPVDMVFVHFHDARDLESCMGIVRPLAFAEIIERFLREQAQRASSPSMRWSACNAAPRSSCPLPGLGSETALP